MRLPPANLTTLLSELAKSGVEFILVGGLAAVAQGAPLTTHDVDIVPNRTDHNIDLLVAFVTSQDGHYRGRPERIEPTANALRGPGHHLLRTALGPLDILGAIEGGRDYDMLLPRTIELELDGRSLRVLSLEMLIELKRDSTHPKDQNTLAILEATRQTDGD